MENTYLDLTEPHLLYTYVDLCWGKNTPPPPLQSWHSYKLIVMIQWFIDWLICIFLTAGTPMCIHFFLSILNSVHCTNAVPYVSHICWIVLYNVFLPLLFGRVGQKCFHRDRIDFCKSFSPFFPGLRETGLELAYADLIQLVCALLNVICTSGICLHKIEHV